MIKELAHRTGHDRKSAEALCETMRACLIEHCGMLHTVAIPGFGQFEGVKHDEEIITDHATGERTLLPPEIVVNFKAAGKLRKITRKHADD